MNQIVERLAGNNRHVSSADVSRLVHEEHARFEGRPIRDFVPLFVERSAKEELAKLSNGPEESALKTVNQSVDLPQLVLDIPDAAPDGTRHAAGVGCGQ